MGVFCGQNSDLKAISIAGRAFRADRRGVFGLKMANQITGRQSEPI